MEFFPKADKSSGVRQTTGQGNHAVQKRATHGYYLACKVEGPKDGLDVAEVAAGLGLPGGNKKTKPCELVLREPVFHFKGIEDNTHKLQLSRGREGFSWGQRNVQLSK